jgi:hypothetical protein
MQAARAWPPTRWANPRRISTTPRTSTRVRQVGISGQPARAAGTAKPASHLGVVFDEPESEGVRRAVRLRLLEFPLWMVAGGFKPSVVVYLSCSRRWSPVDPPHSSLFPLDILQSRRRVDDKCALRRARRAALACICWIDLSTNGPNGSLGPWLASGLGTPSPLEGWWAPVAQHYKREWGSRAHTTRFVAATVTPSLQTLVD